MSQAFKKITHLVIAVQNMHAFTREQGSDLSSYSLDLSPIDTDCSIVKQCARRVSYIKDRHSEIYYQNWCTLI